jgi:putative endonuclease
MFYTYILECSDKTYYTGSTNNLEKRIFQHNNSKNGAHYTKIRRPVMLKYFETFENLGDSRRREAELKKWPRSKKETLWEKDDILKKWKEKKMKKE